MGIVNEKVRKLREQMNLSQRYVAQYLGISRSTVTQMENGHRKISTEELQKLCRLFGVSSNMLLENTEMSQPAALFARSFERLDEIDQAEIINLIRFKEQMKAQRGKL